MAVSKDVAIYIKAIDRATATFTKIGRTSTKILSGVGKAAMAASGVLAAAGASVVAVTTKLAMAAAREEEVFDLLRFQVENLGIAFARN